jgi:pimeloyl-ACP methyl ester carboxylesterase
MSACGGVKIADLAAPRPAPPSSCIVVGLLGGLDSWDESDKGVRRLALALRDRRDRVYAETFENRRVGIARRFVVLALDADRDGALTPRETGRTRLVIYGQSLGGMAAVRLARLLEHDGVPVELLVLIDSVGWADEEVPANVRHAANLYQDDGAVIRGEHPIRPADPDATRIVGQWEFEYDVPPGSMIRVDDLPWHKLAFRVAHAKMDRDPRVWERVERLIRSACGGAAR